MRNLDNGYTKKNYPTTQAELQVHQENQPPLHPKTDGFALSETYFISSFLLQNSLKLQEIPQIKPCVAGVTGPAPNLFRNHGLVEALCIVGGQKVWSIRVDAAWLMGSLCWAMVSVAT